MYISFKTTVECIDLSESRGVDYVESWHLYISFKTTVECIDLSVSRGVDYVLCRWILHKIMDNIEWSNSGRVTNNKMFVFDRFNRLAIIRNMRWEFGSVLPADVRQNLSEQEVRSWGLKMNVTHCCSFKITSQSLALSKALNASTGPLWIHELHRYYTARYITVLDSIGSKHGF